MVHAKERRRLRARAERPKHDPDAARRKAQEIAARRRAGLTGGEARVRYRMRTLAECGVHVGCWLVLVLATLPMC